MDKKQILKNIDYDKKVFNNFKNVQDKKYYLWCILSNYCLKGCENYNKPFIIEKYNGSNQIILYENEKIIYNSEKDIFKKQEFINFVFNIALKIYNRIEKTN